ncbi:MAG: hypothetical protein IPN22_03400, partial [Bacteroidetes bacterium]|nr:hypothetical protein [Bacteroidota bacterium]
GEIRQVGRADDAAGISGAGKLRKLSGVNASSLQELISNTTRTAGNNQTLHFMD